MRFPSLRSAVVSSIVAAAVVAGVAVAGSGRWPDTGGGGGGSVNSVTAGTNVTVTGTATDPIVNAATQFGPATTILLPNSTPTDVTAAAFDTTLPTTTAGSERGRFVISVKRGASTGTVQYDADELILDTAGTSKQVTFKYGGATYGSISAAGGRFVFDAASTGELKNNGTAIAWVRAKDRGGLQMQQAPFTPAQWVDVASANNFTPPITGDGGVVSGTTQMNLINYADTASTTLYGKGIWIYVLTGFTFKHNQAPSGTFAPIMLNGSVDFAAPAGTLIKFRLCYQAAAPYWFEESRRIP